jgi:hypothetical protein
MRVPAFDSRKIFDASPGIAVALKPQIFGQKHGLVLTPVSEVIGMALASLEYRGDCIC